MLPIVFAFSNDGTVTDVNVKAFVYCIMIGASADFATPIGYQTNLMVWGPGGYATISPRHCCFHLPLHCCR
jgi:di/tricarboxylate transporter